MAHRESETLTTDVVHEQQLRDVADVVFACKLDGCFSSVLESAASLGRSQLLGALLQRLGESTTRGNAPNTQTAISATLLAAADRGRAQCLRLLLDAVSSSTSFPSSSSSSIAQLLVDARDGEGRFALYMAARAGHAECTRLLLAHSPNTQVSTATPAGWTALMVAASSGHVSCLQLLLAHSPGIQVRAVTRAGSNALISACLKGQTSCVQLLLAHSPDDQVAAVNRRGRNALMTAASGGYAACTQLLLANSPEIQVAAVGSTGQNALMAAAEKGHASCMELLLEHSPDVQLAAVDAAGRSAVTHAAFNGHTSCLQLLLARDLPDTRLDECLRAVCQRLAALDRQPVLDQSSSRPSKELSLAVVACAELLLANGAALGAEATAGDREALRPITRQLAARALVPNMANEAVVGLALAASGGRKRQASGDGDAAGLPGRPRL